MLAEANGAPTRAPDMRSAFFFGEGKQLEAGSGIEPLYTALQAAA